MSLGRLAPGVLDQNASRGFSRGAEEMTAAIPDLRLIGADQPQVVLMHEDRRLQRLTRLFVGQLRPREFAQFVLDQRRQLLGRGRVARFNLLQDLSFRGLKPATFSRVKSGQSG